MKKLKILTGVLLFGVLQMWAQTAVTGTVTDMQSGKPLSAVKVTVMQQNISTQTNAEGKFTITYLDAGMVDIYFSADGYLPQIKQTELKENQTIDLGKIVLRSDISVENRQDIILQLSENQLIDEADRQSQSGTFASQTDVYLSQTGYSFSPMHFRTRGYDNKYESTYINGVHFLDAERGGFNYSSTGGLNNAMRSKDVTFGLSPNTYSFGNIGSNTNINTRASSFAAGSNANIAISNRSYKYRAQYTYGTGVLNNGWAFAVSGVIRWADDNNDILKTIEGTFYNSAGLFLSAEKILNDKHTLSLVAFGAPTRRAGQAAITKEARDLAGSIYYNPYWGYQDGKVRNSRIVFAFDPTAILSHDFKISETQRLHTGVGFHYSFYSNSAMAYNGTHPAPDYYRKMPSYAYSMGDEKTGKWLTELWQNNKSQRQMDWNLFYYQNKENNKTSPDGQAAYAQLRRHNNLMETVLNSVYTNTINKNLKLTAGIEAKTSKGIHYQTVDDLLGANQLLDFDTYADRDMTGNNSGWTLPPLAQYVQNDMRNPNRKVHEGDIWGYNYAIHTKSTNAFAQLEYTWDKLFLYAAAKVTYTDFYREGYMENGRAWYLRYLYNTPAHPDHDKGQDVNSLGKSKLWYFADPSVKGGFMYSIDNKSRLAFNVLAETRAPLVQDVYISERIKDAIAPNLKPEKILSFDANYTFNYKPIRGRVSAFRTVVQDAIDKYGYYDDENLTFVNHLLSGYNKLYQGVEAGVSIPVNSWLTVDAAGTYADYRYTSDAIGIKSPENGSFIEITPSDKMSQDEKNQTTILTKGLKIAAGPQLAANITASFFYKMWFLDVTLNYFDNNYLDFAPNRFILANYGNLPAKFYSAENLQNLQDFFTDKNGVFNSDKFTKYLTVTSEDSPEKKAYWAQFGITPQKPTIDWGIYGEVLNADKSGLNNDVRSKLATQEKLKGGFTIDASIGRVMYLKNRNSLNINLSLSNILNNTDMATGGYQQARIPFTDNTSKKVNTKALNWYSNKYYYAMGFNFFLNVGFRFSGLKSERPVTTAAFEELPVKTVPRNEVAEQPKEEPKPVVVEQPKPQVKEEPKTVEQPKAHETKPATVQDNSTPKCVFETNTTKLSAASKEYLDGIIKELKADESLLALIKGHTDNTGGATFNQRLSEQRANAVKAYFVKNGISSKRILAAGFGDTKPIADNATAEGRAKNRRVEIIIE